MAQQQNQNQQHNQNQNQQQKPNQQQNQNAQNPARTGTAPSPGWDSSKPETGTGRQMSGGGLESDIQADGVPGTDRDIQGRPVEVYAGRNQAAGADTGRPSTTPSRSLTDEDVDADEVEPESTFQTNSRPSRNEGLNEQI